MSKSELETIASEQLVTATGGFSASDMPADARWIMQRESGGRTNARNPTSSAFGAFQMLRATRQQYMGGNANSTDLGAQYQGATKYVTQRYGGWTGARHFWQGHHWY
jgi:hypothetical protein